MNAEFCLLLMCVAEFHFEAQSRFSFVEYHKIIISAYCVLYILFHITNVSII